MPFLLCLFQRWLCLIKGGDDYDKGNMKGETFRGSRTPLRQCTHYFLGRAIDEGMVRKREEQRRKPGNDVRPSEKMLVTNRHLESGVCNNHTSRADFEENCSLDGPTEFYKGKAIFDQNHKITRPFYRDTYFFPIYFHLAPCMEQVWWGIFVLAEYIHITHI